MTLEIRVPGATPAEIERGMAAAWKVFYEARMSPEVAITGNFDVDGEEFGMPASDEAFERADVWNTAADAALEACCDGWAKDRKPLSALLEIKEAREESERETATLRKRLAELEALNPSPEELAKMIEEEEKAIERETSDQSKLRLVWPNETSKVPDLAR